MGVVYKLNTDVIDFIVNKKKEESDVSCRKMVDIVNEKFNLNISKSSINTIFKNFKLSCSVGRRQVREKKVKKFKLPDSRKLDVLSSVNSIDHKSSITPKVEMFSEPKQEHDELVDLIVKASEISHEDNGLHEEVPVTILEDVISNVTVLDDSQKNVIDLDDEIKDVSIKEAAHVEVLSSTNEEEKENAEYDAILAHMEESLALEGSSLEFSGEENSVALHASLDQGGFSSMSKVLGLSDLPAQDELIDNMGCYFIKAAQHLLTQGSFFGKFIQQCLNGNSSLNADSISDVALFAKMFDVNSLDYLKVNNSQGLRLLSGLGKEVDMSSVAELIETLEHHHNFPMRFAQEIPQFFSEISTIKIALEDRTQFCIDAQQTTLWHDEVPQRLTLPMESAMAVISDQFISNIKPLIFCGFPGQPNNQKLFYDLLAAFANTPGKRMIRIAALDRQNEELAQFAMIPSQQRFWIAGVWAWQSGFKSLINKSLQTEEIIFLESLRREVFISSFEVDLDRVAMQHGIGCARGFVVKEKKNGPAVVAIVTNIAQERMSSEEVVENYILRWPNLHKGFNVNFVNNVSKQFSGTKDVGIPSIVGAGNDVLMNARKAFVWAQQYCISQFFPEGLDDQNAKQIIADICKMPGVVRNNPGVDVVMLKPAADYPYLGELKYAIQRVNENNIISRNRTNMLLDII
ncbi:MAG: hypothetical protein GY861_23910 [bacterium]|nr:hypothetical protein [bacterium]